MRFNILSIYIISLLTVSCVEKENTDKKIEIYLTNKRIESYEGIKPENLKDTTKFKDLLERFNKIAIKLDTINNDIIFAGAFNANDEDLDVKPLINSNEILMFDFTSSKIIMKESVVKKIKDLDWKMGDDFGRQFVLCINKKPVLKIIKVDEKGTPIQWRVIRSDDWENLKRQNPTKYKAVKQKENLNDHKLETGDFYLDRLRSNVVEYDEFGNDTGQKYTEFMMPPHFKSQLQNSVAWNQSLPDAVAKMFGIRIPSQDKHSAVNLKLVDYLPVFMGSSAMYARELIELSGADFDIDKLYMQMKEFYYNGSEFVEYGKAKNEASGYKEYVRWVLENATKASAIRQALNRWNDAEKVKLATGITADEYNALTLEEQNEARKKITSANNKITIDLLDAVMHSDVPLDAVMINKMFDRSEGLPESLESIGFKTSKQNRFELLVRFLYKKTKIFFKRK